MLLQGLDKVAETRDLEEVYDKEMHFRGTLENAGLEEIRIEVLTLRVLYNMSFADIADELSIPNRQTAFYIFKRSCQLLEERGIIG